MRLMVLVKNADVGDANAKLVLLILAEHACDDGSSAYPSIARIMRDAHLGRGPVKRALKFLRDRNFIKAVVGARQHYATCYAINVRGLAVATFPKFKSAAGRPAVGAREPDDFPGAFDDPTPAERRAAALRAAREGIR